MAIRTNIAKIIDNPDAGRHYLMKNGVRVNELANTRFLVDVSTLNSINAIRSGAMTETVNDGYADYSITFNTGWLVGLGGAVYWGLDMFPEDPLPTSLLQEYDHILFNFKLDNTRTDTETAFSGLGVLDATSHASSSRIPGWNTGDQNNESGWVTVRSDDMNPVIYNKYLISGSKGVVSRNFEFVSTGQELANQRHYSISTHLTDETELHFFDIGFAGKRSGTSASFTKTATISIIDIWMQNT